MAQKDQMATKLRKAIETLTPYSQQVIRMRYLEEMRNKEIAAVLGKKEGAIRQATAVAVGQLRKILKDDS